MKIDLKNVKTCVFGIQGSGKTYLTTNFLINNFKHAFIYEIHPEDFKHLQNSRHYIFKYEPASLRISTLNDVCKQVKELGKKKEIDAFILDEADLFLKNHVYIPPAIQDLVLNHRHYNLALIFITRRPQSIPTEIVESCEHMFIFKIEGDNVIKKFKEIHPDIPPLIQKLKKEDYNFVYKHLGDTPTIHNKIKSKSETQK